MPFIQESVNYADDHAQYKLNLHYFVFNPKRNIQRKCFDIHSRTPRNNPDAHNQEWANKMQRKWDCFDASLSIITGIHLSPRTID